MNFMKPKYVEIYDEISQNISTGVLKSGEKLPSKRDMAMHYNVSINTIMNAYDLLLEEGYIYSIEKKGYYVEKMLLVNKKPVFSDISEDHEENPIYDFTTQKVKTFPSTSWKKILRDEISKESYYNKTNFLGDLRLRFAISSHLKENRGILVDPHNILIGSGMEMLDKVIRLTEIDNITLENPGYQRLSSIAENLNLKVNYISLDEAGTMVPSHKTILYATPFNQFPTGIKMTISRKKEIVSFLDDTGSFLIEDDFDAEFRINANPSSSIYSLNPEKTIFFSTFTETIYPGLRISYAILPKEIMNKYRILYKDYSCSVPTLEQNALSCFMEEGYYESHINKTKREYIRKRHEILNILKDHENFSADEKKNYLSLLVKIKTELTDLEIKKILKDHGIKMALLSDMDMEKKDSHTLILGYTAMDMDKIREGLLLLFRLF